MTLYSLVYRYKLLGKSSCSICRICCLFFFFVRGPRSWCYGRTAALTLIVQPLWWRWRWRWAVFYQVLQVMEHQCNKIDRENRQLGEKPVPVPLCPPQISHGLDLGLNRDRTPGLRGERPTINRLSHGTAKLYFIVTLFSCQALSYFPTFRHNFLLKPESLKLALYFKLCNWKLYACYSPANLATLIKLSEMYKLHITPSNDTYKIFQSSVASELISDLTRGRRRKSKPF
jgi:hypothetical protein